ncbi:hypothetical protein [Comamonas sp. lk]|uniref:hypothetical protein n=1 Tax=Comamonas sp. lk TaxID=2201272 RepID=UPI0013CE68E5|nr:hypothetical protein [Comamonas sp. lk]
MQFSDPFEFLKVFGSGTTASRLGQAIGVAPKIAARMAKQSGKTPLRSEKPIPGLEHLPGLPDFAITRRTKAGGTVHQIDCNEAGDSPGYRSLLIHRCAMHCEDEPEEDETP